MQELGTAAQYNIPLTAIVWNNSSWGVLKGQQRTLFNERYMASDLVNPDFVRLTESYGLEATRVENLAELETTLDGAIKKPGLSTSSRCRCPTTSPGSGNAG